MSARTKAAKIPATFWRQKTKEFVYKLFLLTLYARPDRASRPVILSAAKNLCHIPSDIVRRSVRTNYDSTLVTFLRTLFPPETITRLITDYCLGVTRDRSAIFFQLDIQCRCRGGKIIQYNPQTGHRIKDATAKIPVDWIHPRLKAQGILPASWTMPQCLFGERLLPKHPDATVVLVEAEKTAVIGSGFVPEFVWVATGGRSGLNDRVNVLEKRKILAFPDVDAYDYWKEKFKARPQLEVYISDYLQKNASPNDLEDHIDIADWLVRWKNDPDTADTPGQAGDGLERAPRILERRDRPGRCPPGGRAGP